SAQLKATLRKGLAAWLVVLALQLTSDPNFGDGILAAGVVTNPLSAARQGDQSSAHAAGSTAGAARFNKCVTVAQE
ncbi:hypothetical protein ACI4CD_28875, partial [Klebsiella pneumoniae]|uniref:hypothetical protein n=1 Tax=Klebsiella pneumoniae TaxID=573 RepID=UPI003852B625